MAETTEKRKLVRRPAEERVAELDAKINSYKEMIQKLEKKKEAILNSKPRGSKAGKTKAFYVKAKEAGFTDEELEALLNEAISKKANQDAE